MNAPVEKAKLIIAQRFREVLSLDSLAEEVGWSKFHFLREFKRETGITPGDYISTVRLEHAAHVLRMFPRASITDVAFEAGFSSPSVFSRAFRHKFNASPATYKSELPEVASAMTSNRTIPITYLDRKTLSVTTASLLEDRLNAVFTKVIAEENTGKIYGIYIDAPMHKSPEVSRYYVGVETTSPANNLTYQIDSGYYTYLDIEGDFNKVIQRIVDFKENCIDPSPYTIDSLVGFEVIHFNGSDQPFDYFSVPRRIFIKVKRA